MSGGLCTLHSTGLLPLECRFCHHSRIGQGIKCHEALGAGLEIPKRTGAGFTMGTEDGAVEQVRHERVERPLQVTVDMIAI